MVSSGRPRLPLAPLWRTQACSFLSGMGVFHNYEAIMTWGGGSDTAYNSVLFLPRYRREGGLCTSHTTQNTAQVTTGVAKPRDGEIEPSLPQGTQSPLTQNASVVWLHRENTWSVPHSHPPSSQPAHFLPPRDYKGPTEADFLKPASVCLILASRCQTGIQAQH